MTEFKYNLRNGNLIKLGNVSESVSPHIIIPHGWFDELPEIVLKEYKLG